MKRTTGRCPYHCGIGAAFAIIGGKWKARIICHTSEGRSRFNALRDTLENVNPVCSQNSSGNPGRTGL